MQDTPNLSRELLISRFRISDQEATEVLIDLQKLKLFHDGFSYYCDDYENLLRTVKNPFEKGKRVKDLNELLSQAHQIEADCDEFRGCIDKMRQKIEDTKDNITFVMKRDLPWFLTNIPLIILTALTVPFIGGCDSWGASTTIATVADRHRCNCDQYWYLRTWVLWLGEISATSACCA